MVKICTKCKKEKSLSEFKLRKERSNRPKSACNSCERERYRKYHASSRGKAVRAAAYSRFIKSKTPAAIAYNKRKSEKQKQSGERAAKSAVNEALRNGIIFRKNVCSGCFRENVKTGFHHYKDYSPKNALAVVELCYSCHYEAHQDKTHQFHPEYSHANL